MTDPTVDALSTALTKTFGSGETAYKLVVSTAPDIAAALAKRGYVVVRAEDVARWKAVEVAAREVVARHYTSTTMDDLRAALATKETATCDIVEDPFGMDKSDQENSYYCRTHDQHIGPADKRCRAALEPKP